jgi:hypothetical protein
MQPLLTVVVERLQELQAYFGPFVGWLKEWQFLLGSLIAGFAGVLIVSAINRQDRRQSFEAIEERRRRVRAFRTTMPGDLHAICSYARRSAEVGRDALLFINADEEEQQSPSTKGRQTKLRCPALPTSVPLNLKALIENLDDATADRVADLVRCYHSQHARLAGVLENFNSSRPSTITASKTINLNSVFKDTLELYLRAKGMLQFARGESENIASAFNTSEVLNALQVLNIDHVISPEAREYCLRLLSSASTGQSLSRRQRDTSDREEAS